MRYQTRRTSLDPVLEDSVGPPSSFTRKALPAQCKPHKYGSQLKLESQWKRMSPWSFLVRLRDRYIKAMNEMATGADFTAVTGYHGWAEFDYTLQHCKTVKERRMEEMEEESAATTQSKSQAILL